MLQLTERSSGQRFSTAENQALGPNIAHPYHSLNPQMSISSECRQWSAWSNQEMTDHFLQPTQELHNSNNFALMWARAAAEMIVLKCKDHSFSSNASNRETSHNLLCRLAKSTDCLTPFSFPESGSGSMEQNTGALWVWTGQWDKMQSEEIYSK